MKFDGVFGEEVKGVRKKGLGVKETKKMARVKKEKDEIWEGVCRKNMNQLEGSNLRLLTLLPARFGRFDKCLTSQANNNAAPVVSTSMLVSYLIVHCTPNASSCSGLIFRYVSFIYCGSGAMKDKSMLMVPFPIAPLPDLHLEPRTRNA